MRILARIRQVEFSRHWPFLVIALAGLAAVGAGANIIFSYGLSANRALATLRLMRNAGASYSTSGWEAPRRLAQGSLIAKPASGSFTSLHLQDTAIPIDDKWIETHADGLSHLPGLTLNLQKTRVTDRAFECLAQLENLHGFYMPYTDIGDAALAHLAGHKQISHLTLSDTRVSDAGLSFVRSLPSLRHLSIANTEVTGAGLRHLAQLWNLSVLEVDGVQASGPGLDALAELRLTRTLSLRGRLVDDTTVNNIAKLSHVQHLTVYGPGVTDACIPALLRMQSLRYITLIDTNVTDDGLAELQQVFSAANAQRVTLPPEMKHYSRN